MTTDQAHSGHAGYRVGDPLPAVMVARDLAALLHLQVRRACQLQKAGVFAIFEITPRLGNKPRYSGRRVQQWIDGDLHAPALRRYFSSAKG